MTQLLIEYVLDGPRRGYNFTSSTAQFDDASLKAIWRAAMPRGRGWSDPRLLGARSLKAFVLPDERVAISETVVTDQVDDTGRRGLRRSSIDVMTVPVYRHFLQSRWKSYPDRTQQIARSKRPQILDALGRSKRHRQLLIGRPFVTVEDWWVVEAIIIDLAANPPTRLKRRGDFLTFTTLALANQDESRIVAIPDGIARQIEQPVTHIT